MVGLPPCNTLQKALGKLLAHPSFQSRGYTCPDKNVQVFKLHSTKKQISTTKYQIAFNPRPLCSQPQQLHHLGVNGESTPPATHGFLLEIFSQAAEEDVTLQMQVQKVQESQHRFT